jgi:hypothetical protein
MKAPLLLFRFPGLFVSVALGALLLALAISSYPLFISASESNVLDGSVRGASRFGVGIAVTQSDRYVFVRGEGLTVDPLGIVYPALGRPGEFTWEPRTRILDRQLGDIEQLGDPVLTILGPTVSMSKPGGTTDLHVRLLSKSGWQQHVKMVEGDPDAHGMWLADTVAETIGVHPGDEVVFESQDVTRRVEVVGIYEALVKSAIATPYWGSLTNEIYPQLLGDPEPPAFALLDPEDLADVAPSLGYEDARFTWEYPIRTSEPLTLPLARKLEERFDVFQHDFGNTESRLGRAFFCTALCVNSAGVGNYASLLSTIVPQIDDQISAIKSPIDLLSTAGTIVALTVIASAGVFMIARRKTEAALLFARGAGAASVGFKTVIESVIPALLGTAAGFGIAWLLVSVLGPDGAIDPSARDQGIRSAAMGIPVSVALIGIVATISFLRQSEAASSRLRSLANLPWEIAVLALAGFCLRNLLNGRAIVQEARSVARPSAYLLLFPIFFVGGFAGLAARSLQPPLKRLVKGSRGMGDASYLTLHRLAGARRLAVVLVTACALALGILVYAQTVVNSLETTVDAKSLLFVGSDVQAQIRFDQDPPSDIEFPMTKVTKMPSKGALPGREAPVDVVAVDPDTLASAAYWSSSFAADPLEELASRLGESRGDRVPVVIAGWDDDSVSNLQIGHVSIPIEVIALPKNFPGRTLGDPIVAIDVAAIARFNEVAGFPDVLQEASNSSELWIKGPTGAILNDLAASETTIFQTLTAREVRTIPSIVTVTRTFGYLKSLGFGAGLLAIVSLVMYLQARQRNRVVSFALSRRMGLSNSKHRLSLVLELGGMLVAAFAVATGLALVAARLILDEIEPLKKIPPDSLFEIPVPLLVACGAVLLLTAIAGGYVTNRTAEKANFAEVMRLAA